MNQVLLGAFIKWCRIDKSFQLGLLDLQGLILLLFWDAAWVIVVDGLNAS